MRLLFDIIDAAPELEFYGAIGALLVVVLLLDRTVGQRWAR